MLDDTRFSFDSTPSAAVEAGATLAPVFEADARITALVSRYGDMLQRFLLSLTRRRDAAEDLSQQLWLKLLEAARSGRFQPADHPAVRSYLFAAARNLFLDECVRKHASSRTTACDPRDLETLMCAGTAPAVDVIHAELECEERAAAVTAAIRGLPDSQRTVIRLWMTGGSIESMAAATGAPRNTVLSRKKYALRRLRTTLVTVMQ
jgi:RNA polymerase sigma-70 factor (ECF subfamily)